MPPSDAHGSFPPGTPLHRPSAIDHHHHHHHHHRIRRSEGDASASYTAWWTDVYSYYGNLDTTQRCLSTLTNARYLVLGVGLLYQRHTTWLEMVVVQCVVIGFLILYQLASVDVCSNHQFLQRLLKALWFTMAIVIPISLLVAFQPSAASIMHGLQTFLGLVFIWNFFLVVCLSWGFNWPVLLSACKLYDIGLGLVLLVPQFILALLYVPGVIQTRLLFNNAFSRGVIIDDILKGGSDKKRPTAAAAAATGNATAAATTAPDMAALHTTIAEQRVLLMQHQQKLEKLEALLGSGTSSRPPSTPSLIQTATSATQMFQQKQTLGTLLSRLSLCPEV